MRSIYQRDPLPGSKLPGISRNDSTGHKDALCQLWLRGHDAIEGADRRHPDRAGEVVLTLYRQRLQTATMVAPGVQVHATSRGSAG